MSNEIAIVIKDSSSSSTSSNNSSSSGSNTTNNLFGKTLKTLGAIGISIALLSDLLKPIVAILKYILALILIPLLRFFLHLLGPAIQSILDLMTPGTDINKNAVAGVDLAKSGFSTMFNPEKFMDTFKDFMQGLKDAKKVPGLIGDIIRGFGLLMTPVVFVVDILKTIVQGVIWAVRKIIIGFGIINDDFSKMGELARSIVITAFNKISDSLGSIWSTISDKFNDMKIGLGKSWESVKNVWTNIKINLNKSWESVKSVWTTIKTGLENIWSGIKGAFDAIISAIRGAINSIPFVHIKSPKSFGGTITSDGMYPLHSGEQINSRDNVRTGNVFNINITGMNNSDEIIRKLTSEISRRIGI